MIAGNKHWVEEIFEECGAILDGHFILNSRRHSGKYLDKTMIYPDGKKVYDICLAMASDIALVFPESADKKIEVVLGLAEGGIILAHEVAKRLSELYRRKVPSVFTEKNSRGNQVLKRQFFKKIVAGKSVLIVDDIMTTGLSVKKAIKEVRKAGGRVIAVEVIARRGEISGLDCPFFWLWKVDIDSWSPEQCLLCQKGIPINKIK